MLEVTLKINNITIAILRGIGNSILRGIGAPKKTAKANGNAKHPNNVSIIIKENFLTKHISNSDANTYVKLRGDISILAK
ncbi:hypothetical protein IB665_02135 [Francisella tularensis subsp. mediasiatica]|nr:hypothetical protein [Francisella tularensis]MBK2077637.1 hypothetical protein [Francisella tularensis subsp. mediasiatica]NVG85460.1 hypothetical protein [Francisella tularensis]